MEIVEESSKIYLKTSRGDKEVKILPSEAISNSLKIENVEDIKIEEFEGEAVYVVSGNSKARLFFLLPVSAKVEQKINSESGEVVSTKKPWWSFLALGV